MKFEYWKEGARDELEKFERIPPRFQREGNAI